MEVSVIMSVYNTDEKFLRDSIESILNQEFEDFEFIIINDGSQEETVKIIESYTDDRIVRINNIQNIGLTQSLNVGLRVAKGKYIARMDADDISYKLRLKKQYNFMEKHKNVDVLGVWTTDGKHVQKHDGNISSESRKVRMLFKNAGIAHPTAFIRNAFLKQNGIQYDETIKKSQDYKLWIDCLACGGIFAVYPETLLLYRIHDKQISADVTGEQSRYAQEIRINLIRQLCSDITDAELQQFIFLDKAMLSQEQFKVLCEKIEKGNNEKKIYNAKYLQYELGEYRKRLYKSKDIGCVGYYLYYIKRMIKKQI